MHILYTVLHIQYCTHFTVSPHALIVQLLYCTVVACCIVLVVPQGEIQEETAYLAQNDLLASVGDLGGYECVGSSPGWSRIGNKDGGGWHRNKSFSTGPAQTPPSVEMAGNEGKDTPDWTFAMCVARCWT